jgi:PhnB protein
MAAEVKPIPTGYATITPNLVIRDAAKAVEFYQKAFGAEQIVYMTGPDGKVLHAELRIGDSKIMLGEEMAETGSKAPQAYGGSPVSFYVYVNNVDAAWKRAVDAGGTIVMALQDMFWGDRTGRLVDPFGHVWALAQHVKDLTPEEMKEAQEAFFRQAQPA